MATIVNPRLAVSTDQLHDRASISVSCDVDFTDVELNAIQLLGLRYHVQCELVDKDLWIVKPVAVFDDWTLPRTTELTVSKHEHVVFNTDRPMTDLHTHFLVNNQLQAVVKLRNDETGKEVVARTDFVAVDLAV
jgi:hypothetical protein